jgi:hypothetical protein
MSSGLSVTSMNGTPTGSDLMALRQGIHSLPCASFSRKQYRQVSSDHTAIWPLGRKGIDDGRSIIGYQGLSLLR